MAEKVKNILSTRKHPLYTENISLWEDYYSAVKGGKWFITSKNLFTHRLESAEDYESRLERAYYLNLCDTVCSLYNTYIFKERIERPADKILDESFRHDVDGNGTDIQSYIDAVGLFSSVYGVMHVLVETPAISKDRITVREQKKSGIRPYCTTVYPQELKDWAYDTNHNLEWILIENKVYEDSDPMIERVTKKEFKLITKTEWKIVDEEGELVQREGLQSSGINTLGYVPLISIYNRNIEDDLIGESLLKDIFFINRVIFNWCSCTDEQIERQTFSQLVIPDSGTLAEQQEIGEQPMQKLGTSSMFTFPADAKHPPAFISPNTDTIKTIWNLILDHIKEIFRLAKLIGTSDDIYASRSGRAAQFGFLGVNSALAKKAKTFEKLENDIGKEIYRQLGKTTEDYVSVKYADTFDVSSLVDEIDVLFKIMEKNFSSVLNKELQKNIARGILPLATDNIKEQIETEIENSDGVVLSEKASTTEKETGDKKFKGDGNPNTKLSQQFKSSDTTEVEEKGKQAIDGKE